MGPKKTAATAAGVLLAVMTLAAGGETERAPPGTRLELQCAGEHRYQVMYRGRPYQGPVRVFEETCNHGGDRANIMKNVTAGGERTICWDRSRESFDTNAPAVLTLWSSHPGTGSEWMNHDANGCLNLRDRHVAIWHRDHAPGPRGPQADASYWVEAR